MKLANFVGRKMLAIKMLDRVNVISNDGNVDEKAMRVQMKSNC